MGFQYTRGANVAYSLYGSQSGFGSCSSSTFINSFYTLDGLYSFAQATGVSLSSVPSSGYNDRELNEQQQVCTQALTCGDSNKQENTFIQASFTDGLCQPAGYSATLDTLDTLNKDLMKQSCVKISYDTALSLLMYSQTCTALSGSQCPDPHGILADCEQKYVAFQQFVALDGEDPTKPRRYVTASLMFVAAFLIYGFALLKKEKMELESREQMKADLAAEKSVSFEKDRALVESSSPASSYPTISIQNAAISFARSVSMAAQPAVNVIKDVFEDDVDEEEEEEDTDKKGKSHEAQDYVPPVTPDYVGETTSTPVTETEATTVAPVVTSPTAQGTSTKPKSKKKKKKGFLNKLARVFKKK
jgi:hypothetical protein